MAEKINAKIKGHEKFVLRDGWLTKGLMAVNQNPKIFSGDRGADVLGVGTNMVKAIRYYMQAFDLINENPQKGALLTAEARLIAEGDPYIEDYFTLCLLHLKIARNKEKATVWYLVFNQKELTEFKKEELLEYLKQELFVMTGKEFPEGSIKDDIDVLLNMYGKYDVSSDPEDKLHCPLANLGLVSIENDTYIKKQPDMNKIPLDIVLYIVSLLLGNQESISIEEVSSCLETVFNVPWVQTNEMLDILDREEIIRVDRTAGLDVIYPIAVPTTVNIIKTHYEG